MTTPREELLEILNEYAMRCELDYTGWAEHRLIAWMDKWVKSNRMDKLDTADFLRAKLIHHSDWSIVDDLCNMADPDYRKPTAESELASLFPDSPAIPRQWKPEYLRQAVKEWFEKWRHLPD